MAAEKTHAADPATSIRCIYNIRYIMSSNGKCFLAIYAEGRKNGQTRAGTRTGIDAQVSKVFRSEMTNLTPVASA
jgi:hypothetical protein